MSEPPWCERITDDLVRISLKYQNGFVNSYLVLGADGPRLIDTGPSAHARTSELELRMGELGARVQDLRQVLLTHAHHDHAGACGDLSARSGAEVLVQQDEIGPGPSFVGVRPAAEWLKRHGHPDGLMATPPPVLTVPDRLRLLRGDEVLDFGPLRLELMATPGHSPGLLCALDRARGLLFSSDHLLRTPTPLAVRASGAHPDPFGTYMTSLDRLTGLSPQLILPGHGRSIEDFDQALASARSAHLQWLEQAHAAVGSGGVTNLEVADRLGWASARDPGRRWLAIARVGAYLDHLQAQGRLRQVSDQQVRWFPGTKGVVPAPGI
jgi:glyoxylase-like metal-dependent hydrolase (beta-lactamase superfamily II)